MNVQTLGDAETDAIVKNILDIAHDLFPAETAQAESWINERLAEYGISYAKYQAEKAAMTIYPWLQNPITWIVGAFILWRVFK